MFNDDGDSYNSSEANVHHNTCSMMMVTVRTTVVKLMMDTDGKIMLTHNQRKGGSHTLH